jgi:CBS domain-containing protein
MLIEVPATVAEAMTRDAASVEEDGSLQNLLESMRALRVRHLPVTDDNRLIGLITERDLLRAASSDILPHSAARNRDLFERFRVRDVMIRDVVTADLDMSLSAAAKLMLERRIGCLPVIDSSNVVHGILTSSDLVAAIARAPTHR